MSNIPTELKYAATHEWARLEEDGTVTVGISDHAQDALGDVVFVELPDVGTSVDAGAEVAVVESVKAASDIYAPLSGEVVAINAVLDEAPETMNESPYQDGWMFRIQPSNVDELDDLLGSDDYASVVDEE